MNRRALLLGLTAAPLALASACRSSAAAAAAPVVLGIDAATGPDTWVIARLERVAGKTVHVVLARGDGTELEFDATIEREARLADLVEGRAARFDLKWAPPTP
jgi:hypothetical protein